MYRCGEGGALIFYSTSALRSLYYSKSVDYQVIHAREIINKDEKFTWAFNLLEVTTG